MIVQVSATYRLPPAPWKPDKTIVDSEPVIITALNSLAPENDGGTLWSVRNRWLR